MGKAAAHNVPPVKTPMHLILLADFFILKRTVEASSMRRTYVLVKDHLEQAHAILERDDNESRQLGQILEMMIGLIDDLQVQKPQRLSNVIHFPIVARPIPKNL